MSTEFSSVAPKCTVVTGEAAEPLIKNLVKRIGKKFNIDCEVVAIKNEFFGGKITVAGLVTGGDIIKQLTNRNLGERLLIPSVMLRHENDKFLDDITIEQLEEKLSCRVVIVNNNGADLVDAILGIEV